MIAHENAQIHLLFVNYLSTAVSGLNRCCRRPLKSVRVKFLFGFQFRRSAAEECEDTDYGSEGLKFESSRARLT